MVISNHDIFLPIHMRTGHIVIKNGNFFIFKYVLSYKRHNVAPSFGPASSRCHGESKPRLTSWSLDLKWEGTSQLYKNLHLAAFGNI